MAEANVQLVRKWFEEVWNQRRRQTIAELFAPDGVAHGVSDTGGDIRGPAEFLHFFERLCTAFPDIRVVVEDCFGSGDKVVARYSVTMSHTGDYLGLRASGKGAAVTGMSIIRVANGKFVESWDNWDKLALLHQIGAIQMATQSAAPK
jgi:steroid delta-isomerase-like uncharacterized protein